MYVPRLDSLSSSSSPQPGPSMKRGTDRRTTHDGRAVAPTHAASTPATPLELAHGSLSSRSSLPASPRARSTTEPDAHHHTRSPSRLTASLKHFLSRPPVPSPSRSSFHYSAVPSDTDLSFHSFQVPPATAKWSMTSRKSRPPNLVISGAVAAAAIPSPPRAPNSMSADAHRRYASEASAKTHSPKHLPVLAQPKTRNVLRRRPSGSAKLSKPRQSPHEDPPPKQSLSLTPAGALAEAYKQQEHHRDDMFYPPPLSIDSHMSARASHDGGYSQPCYFTSPSEQPADRWTNRLTWTRATPLHQQSTSDPSTRSITRKVSSKWRKARSATPEASPVHDRGHSKGRPSLQEMWKTGTRSAGRSSTADSLWSSPIVDPPRSVSDKEGGKVWRLMRRISTGGLRDRIQSPDRIVPPVPAIPKDLLGKADQGERGNRLVSTPRHPSSLHDTVRPSDAIASSSSTSSDVASMQFFHKTHSSRSSVSSYGEARTSEIALDHHIIAPLEQLRLGDDHAGSGKLHASSAPASRSRSPRRSASVPAGLRTMEDPERPRQESPSSAPALGSPRVVDGIVSLSPPPRPSRSSRRDERVASTGSPSKQVDACARQLDRTSSAQSDATARADVSDFESEFDVALEMVPPPTRAGITFRELGAPRRPPLSEREKVDIWNELLDRSDRAGGTLHINGEAALMSDTIRFSTHSET